VKSHACVWVCGRACRCPLNCVTSSSLLCGVTNETIDESKLDSLFLYLGRRFSTKYCRYKLRLIVVYIYNKGPSIPHRSIPGFRSALVGYKLERAERGDREAPNPVTTSSKLAINHRMIISYRNPRARIEAMHGVYSGTVAYTLVDSSFNTPR
jgi:hypothetical protein